MAGMTSAELAAAPGSPIAEGEAGCYADDARCVNPFPLGLARGRRDGRPRESGAVPRRQAIAGSTLDSAFPIPAPAAGWPPRP